jgi:hypothetical protein
MQPCCQLSKDQVKKWIWMKNRQQQQGKVSTSSSDKEN